MAIIKIVEIRNNNIDREAIKKNWTSYTKKIIKQIVNEWLDTGFALFVLLFFKENEKDLHAFWPIISIDKMQRPVVQDLQSENGESKIIGIEPFPTAGIILSQDDIDIIHFAMHNKHYWVGTEALKIK